MPDSSVHEKMKFLLTHDSGVPLPADFGFKADLLPKQTTAIAWLYKVKRGMLADPVGSGKTIVTLALSSILKAQKQPHRTVVLSMNYASQLQWAREVHDKTNLGVLCIDGTPSQRLKQYAVNTWDVLIVRYSTLLRDIDELLKIDADMLVLDEPSAPQVGGHHHNTHTAKALKRLAKRYERVVLLDATPMQASPLVDMHSLFEIFAPDVFPTRSKYDKRYLIREWRKVRRGRREFMEAEITGYKNLDEFKSKSRPYMMRRHDTTGMPSIRSKVEYLPLTAQQRKFYNQARSGMIDILKQDDQSQGHKQRVVAGWHLLQTACDTTMPFETKPQSSKIDWLIRQLKYSWLPSDKVVLFTRYKAVIDHITERLLDEGIQSLRLTGDESKDLQKSAYDRFRDPDSAYRVLIGTTTLERALNLQVAKYLVAFNTIYNPARMEQLAGRVRRRFSEHSTVFIINLLSVDTLEEKMYAKMEKLAALPDYVFDESSDLFDTVSERELLELVS